MDIRSLPIDILLNRSLFSVESNNNLNTGNLTGSSFAKLFAEVLLQTELSTTTGNPQSIAADLFNSLSSNSLTGIDLSTLGLDAAELDSVPSAMLNGAAQASGSSLEAGTISASELNSHLKGVLTNAGDAFVAAGEKYQISPALLASISMHETGNGTSNAAKYKYNVAGMMGKNGLKTYDSIQESIFDMARNLRQNYLDKGKLTIAQIGAKYAPIGASNDPTNLNHHWVNGVQRNFDTFTKTTDFA
jgi:Mannosyl-glycoprotein endo-beta-N-acetylglucosaminidase